MLGIFYMFFRSRRRAESDDLGASMALIKEEQTPSTSTASPTHTSVSTAYTSAQSDLSERHSHAPSDCQDQDDQQPLIVPPMTPVELCENPRAGPSKDQPYVELSTQIYKSELPS